MSLRGEVPAYSHVLEVYSFRGSRVEHDFIHSQAQWYVLEFCAVRFKSVFQFLDRLGVEWFCPVHQSLRYRPDKINGYRKVTRPLFPGYLFIYVDFNQVHPRKITCCQHVRRFISFGDEPVAVSDEIINQMKTRLNIIMGSSGDAIPVHHELSQILMSDDPQQRTLALLNYLASTNLQHAS